MRRLVGAITCGCVLLVTATTSVMGCGDKVLALGRAVKLRHVSSRSASILLYLRAGTPAAAAVSDLPFQSALKKSSQVVKIVNSASELEEALNRGKYDLIVTDPQDARVVEQQLQMTWSHTVVIPLLYQSTKAEAS